jgi:hypothetical protein
MNGTADLGKLYTIEVTIICPVHFFSWYTSNLILQLDSKMVWADSSTTDHITCTIFGWNIVTRFLDLLKLHIKKKIVAVFWCIDIKPREFFSFLIQCRVSWSVLRSFSCIFCYPKLFLSHPRIPLCFHPLRLTYCYSDPQISLPSSCICALLPLFRLYSHVFLPCLEFFAHTLMHYYAVSSLLSSSSLGILSLLTCRSLRFSWRTYESEISIICWKKESNVHPEKK